MPVSIAQRLCPKAVFLPVRMKLYQEVSSGIMKLFSGFTPDICQISIDEAFLNMTGTDRLFGTIEETGMLIKKAVKDRITSYNVCYTKLLRGVDGLGPSAPGSRRCDFR